VRLIPTQYVRAYARGGQIDANDSAAICEAAARPAINSAAVKTAEQQAIRSLHRIRERLIHERTGNCNQIRSLVAEEGLICPMGSPPYVNGLRKSRAMSSSRSARCLFGSCGWRSSSASDIAVFAVHFHRTRTQIRAMWATSEQAPQTGAASLSHA
jgi:hypothetical protein